MSEKRGLIDVLQQRVDRFEGAKALVLTTFDGVELLTGENRAGSSLSS